MITVNSVAGPNFHEVGPFRVASFLPNRTAFNDEEAKPAEDSLLAELERLPAGGLLPIDLADGRVSSEGARQLLRRALLRLSGGELPDRFLVIQNAAANRYNLRAMLKSEGLVAVLRGTNGSAELEGAVDPAAGETYKFLLSAPEGTAKMAMNHWNLENISTATNRLSNLARLGLARRLGPRPASGGGREYVYSAVR
jgi:hypothetical protein